MQGANQGRGRLRQRGGDSMKKPAIPFGIMGKDTNLLEGGGGVPPDGNRKKENGSEWKGRFATGFRGEGKCTARINMILQGVQVLAQQHGFDHQRA